MAYGDALGVGAAEGSATYKLATRDLGRSAISALTPMVQEVTHEITGMVTPAPVQVATAGTRVRVSASSLLVRRCMLQALSTNTGVIVVGDGAVVAAAGTHAAPTRKGFALPTGNDWVEFAFNDLTNVWLDATVSGDGVSVVYWT